MVDEQHQSCWHYPAWILPNSKEPMHHTNLPSSFNSRVFTANAVSQGISALVPRTNQSIGVHGVFPRIPTHTNPHMNDSQSALLHVIGRKVTPTSACDSTGKKFLIFDHSGDQTRLFFSPSFPPPPQNELLSRTTFGNGKLAELVEHKSPGRKLIIQEQLDGNFSNSYGSERPEDTEEINALLYSDVDSEDDDDEVTSTGHSPFPVQGDFHELGELTKEDMASSVGSSKRQKLLDGGYIKSSVHLQRSHTYDDDDDDDDDAESSCVKGTEFKGEDKNPHFHAREKKAKIREMLKTLETIIPGLKSKDDPLSIFDEAIDYLKHLRLKAKELGLESAGAVLAEGERKMG